MQRYGQHSHRIDLSSQYFLGFFHAEQLGSVLVLTMCFSLAVSVLEIVPAPGKLPGLVLRGHHSQQLQDFPLLLLQRD
jgi:hypothetical protein